MMELKEQIFAMNSNAVMYMQKKNVAIVLKNSNVVVDVQLIHTISMVIFIMHMTLVARFRKSVWNVQLC